MSKFELSQKELCQFLMLAKQNTYAKDAEKSPSKCVLSKNYEYKAGDFRYEDQYFGEYIDVGEEIVWYCDVPVWGMGYRGGIHDSFRNEKDNAFQFLRKALSSPENGFPIRGPRYLKNGIFYYKNNPEGDILNFSGQEFIYRDETEICFRRYVGGLIYGKKNSDMNIIS